MAKHGGPRPGSGRPKGAVSKAKLDIATKAKEYAEQAIQTLADIMTDVEMTPASRVNAANAILDRGYGKPMQAVEVTGKDKEPVAFTGFVVQRATKPD